MTGNTDFQPTTRHRQDRGWTSLVDVEIEFVTPLSGAFTKPVATKVLTDACEDKNIKIVPNFALGSVDHKAKVIQAFDGSEVEYDMLVSIPPNFGAQVMIDSGIADPMGYIPVDKHTLQPEGRDNVWVLGDGTDVPTSKAGARRPHGHGSAVRATSAVRND